MISLSLTLDPILLERDIGHWTLVVGHRHNTVDHIASGIEAAVGNLRDTLGAVRLIVWSEYKF